MADIAVEAATAEEQPIDVTRSVVIAKLSDAVHAESDESFNNIIYGLLEKAFDMSKDNVERIVKYPNLEPESEPEGFACKCLVLFRSRVQKHRIIAQKAKLDAPTTVESITQIPKEILGIGSKLEVVGECADADGNLTKKNVSSTLAQSECSPDQLNKATVCTESNENFEPYKNEIEVEAKPMPCSTGVIGLANVTSDDVALTTTVSSNGCTNFESPDNSKIVDNDEHSASKADGNTENSKDVLKSAVSLCDAKPKSSTADDVSANEPEGVSDANCSCQDKENSSFEAVNDPSLISQKQDLSPVCKVDKHKEHFKTLPISWDGAPEFQWRTVHYSSDRRTLIIENAYYSDITNVWLYPAIVRACDLRLIFDRQNGDGKEPTGKMELKYVDETAVSSCAINYLVHVRTSRGRRLKIYLPQTKTAMRLKNDLEERLGRIREPNDRMHQLIVKPVEDSMTEDDLLEVAFRGYRIKNIEFKMDLLGKRCAVVTFESANAAVAAHLANEFIHFTNAFGTTRWYKVYYPYAVMQYPEGDGLLTRLEYKKFVENEVKKSGKEREDRVATATDAVSEVVPVKLNTIKQEVEDACEILDQSSIQKQNSKQAGDASGSKETKEIIKQKPSKRSFQSQNKAPSAKKPRKSLFTARKGIQAAEQNRRVLPAASQGTKSRRNTRGRRGGKRQQRTLTGGQNGGDWRTANVNGTNVNNTVGSSQDVVQPTPLLTREDYEALQSYAPMKAHPLRSFPKKGKQKNVGNSNGSRPLSRYSRLDPSPQFHSSNYSQDDGYKMDSVYYDPRDARYFGSERNLRRRPEDLDYSSFGPHESAGYGNPSPSVYFNRSSSNFMNDGYDREMENVNDFTRPRRFTMDSPCDNRWNGYDDYLRGLHANHRSADYSGYDRPRQNEGLSYASGWR